MDIQSTRKKAGRRTMSGNSRYDIGPLQSPRTGKYACVIIGALILIMSLVQCETIRIQRRLKLVSNLSKKDEKSPYLKVHMKNGNVYILDEWDANKTGAVLNGKGKHLDFNRRLIDEGVFTIHFEEIALCETNTVGISEPLAAMTVVTAASGIMTSICIINPKACFGSCPTFYAWDGEDMTLQAEAFSTCIAPALEETDVDMLYAVKPERQDFRLKVTNEALETHIIRSAQLLALPRLNNGRTFKSPSGKFWAADSVIEPHSAAGPEGTFLALVKAFDRNERFSGADPDYLAQKETVEITFNTIPGNKSPGKKFPGKRAGLVIGVRQSLLTTYLLYQVIAYMGNSYGYWLSKIEQQDAETKEYISSIGKLLGGIEIFVRDKNGTWIYVDSVNETGPIASDVWIIPLDKLDKINTSSVHIQLRMTKGLWRIDYLGLAGIREQVEPLRLKPDLVFNKDTSDREAKESLLDKEKTLVTFPGDEYTLVYHLPENYNNYELFLESRGYYLEWMRPAWLEEENVQKTLMALTNSKAFLRECAPAYKKLEPEMEGAFWGSKYVSK